MYDESKGFQELTNEPQYGGGAGEINQMRSARAEGREEVSLDDLYHMRSQLEYQLGKATEPDKETIQSRLAEVEKDIARLENDQLSKKY